MFVPFDPPQPTCYANALLQSVNGKPYEVVYQVRCVLVLSLVVRVFEGSHADQSS